MQIVIHPDGRASCIYNEEIDLAAVGSLQICRGSHVEPDRQGRWFADLHPVQGPRLGPFEKRSQALQAELLWLQQNWLPDQTAD